MEYLHSISPHPVIHGDLKIQNVLVGDDMVAKVRTYRVVQNKVNPYINFPVSSVNVLQLKRFLAHDF